MVLHIPYRVERFVVAHATCHYDTPGWQGVDTRTWRLPVQMRDARDVSIDLFPFCVLMPRGEVFLFRLTPS